MRGVLGGRGGRGRCRPPRRARADETGPPELAERVREPPPSEVQLVGERPEGERSAPRHIPPDLPGPVVGEQHESEEDGPRRPAEAVLGCHLLQGTPGEEYETLLVPAPIVQEALRGRAGRETDLAAADRSHGGLEHRRQREGCEGPPMPSPGYPSPGRRADDREGGHHVGPPVGLLGERDPDCERGELESLPPMPSSRLRTFGRFDSPQITPPLVLGELWRRNGDLPRYEGDGVPAHRHEPPGRPLRRPCEGPRGKSRLPRSFVAPGHRGACPTIRPTPSRIGLGDSSPRGERAAGRWAASSRRATSSRELVSQSGATHLATGTPPAANLLAQRESDL